MDYVVEKVVIPIDRGKSVSGLALTTPHARACYVMAHGAGAGMLHPFMVSLANDLGASAPSQILALRLLPHMADLAERRRRTLQFATEHAALLGGGGRQLPQGSGHPDFGHQLPGQRLGQRESEALCRAV